MIPFVVRSCVNMLIEEHGSQLSEGMCRTAEGINSFAFFRTSQNFLVHPILQTWLRARLRLIRGDHANPIHLTFAGSICHVSQRPKKFANANLPCCSRTHWQSAKLRIKLT